MPNPRDSAGVESGTRTRSAGLAHDDGEAAHVRALVAVAKATRAQHGPVRSLRLWREIRECFPHLPAGHVGYAEALTEAGGLAEAEGLLSESARRFPNDLSTWIVYTQVAARRGDLTEALRRWQEVRNRFPDGPAGYVDRAEASRDAGRLDEAGGLPSESPNRFRSDPWAWIQYAQVATSLLDWTEAQRRWQEVRNRFPEHPASAEASTQERMLEGRCVELLRLLRPSRVEGFHKARLGSAHDGGYVMVDDFDGIDAAFSFGIAQDANWDAAVADRRVPVYQFDHTIDAPPISRPDLIFTKERITAEPARGAHTIDELVRRHGTPGKASLILKIDIEGDEWAVFDSVSEPALSCFSQIVAEFHFLGNIMVDLVWYQHALRVFKKLIHSFGVVHVHANNGHGVHSLANVVVPHIVEVTLVNKSRYRLGVTDEIFPGPLDAPNDPGSPDIHLGQFIY